MDLSAPSLPSVRSSSVHSLNSNRSSSPEPREFPTHGDFVDGPWRGAQIAVALCCGCAASLWIWHQDNSEIAVRTVCVDQGSVVADTWRTFLASFTLGLAFGHWIPGCAGALLGEAARGRPGGAAPFFGVSLGGLLLGWLAGKHGAPLRWDLISTPQRVLGLQSSPPPNFRWFSAARMEHGLWTESPTRVAEVALLIFVGEMWTVAGVVEDVCGLVPWWGLLARSFGSLVLLRMGAREWWEWCEEYPPGEYPPPSVVDGPFIEPRRVVRGIFQRLWLLLALLWPPLEAAVLLRLAAVPPPSRSLALALTLPYLMLFVFAVAMGSVKDSPFRTSGQAVTLGLLWYGVAAVVAAVLVLSPPLLHAGVEEGVPLPGVLVSDPSTLSFG